MLDFKAVTITPAFKNKPVEIESMRLAQELAALYKNNFKIALVRHKAIATGKTLRSVSIGKVLDSPSRGLFKRQVRASRSWIFIQKGRKAGGKLPIRKRGRKYEPVPELQEWFLALNIPKRAWFPIMRKIARDGVKPRKVREKMMRDSRPRLAQTAKLTGKKIARTLTASASRQVFS